MLISVVLFVIALAAVAVSYGKISWRSGTKTITARLESGRTVEATSGDSAREDGAEQKASSRKKTAQTAEELPPVVRRYFQKVLGVDTLEEEELVEKISTVTSVRLRQEGRFNMGQEEEDKWYSFTARHDVVTSPPGFLWDARIRMMPGMTAYVHDAYVEGEGILHAALFGVLTVAEMRGPGEPARGELMRYFAEAPWYPTALLSSAGVEWRAVDEHSAEATLTDGRYKISLLFRFNDEDLIESVRAESRGREVKGRIIPTPWEGRWWDYEERGEMLVPTEGEVAWMLSDRRKPYWRGSLVDIHYEKAARRSP